MWLNQLRRALLGQIGRPVQTRRRTQRGKSLLTLECLEAREVPATFNVSAGDTQGLINAINVANTNQQDNTIELASNSTYKFTSIDNSIFGNTALPVIEANLFGGTVHTLTIEGAGASLKRTSGGQFRLLAVDTRAHLILNDVDLIGGDSTSYGGAIYSVNSSLDLDGVVISNNTDTPVPGGPALAYGGAIYSVGGELTIADSQIYDNSADANGANFTASIPALGGAVYTTHTAVTVSNAYFHDNTATGANPGPTAAGGGMAGGGALYINNGSLSISQTTFTNNIARGGDSSNTVAGGEARGGAVYASSATVSVTGSTFNYNYAFGGDNTGTGAAGGTGQDGSAGGNGGAAYGGVLDIEQGTLVISGATIENNTAQGGFGASGARLAAVRRASERMVC